MDDLADAYQFAEQVLIQERREPTVRYTENEPVQAALSVPNLGTAAPVVQRNLHYRRVAEPAPSLHLESSNYDLLLVIFGRLDPQLRPAFLTAMLHRVLMQDAYDRRNVQVLRAGFSDATTSETPLVAEFLIRQNHAEQLIEALPAFRPSPALTHLLLHLRDVVATNFRAFSERQLELLSEKTAACASVILESLGKLKPADRRLDALTSNTFTHVGQEVPSIAAAIVEQCREARFMYLKDALLGAVNTEINQDKERLIDQLHTMGFSSELVLSLDAAERSYQLATDGYALKSSMGHLRSFLEGLNREACSHCASLGSPSSQKWGSTLLFLKDQKIISREEEQFVSAFYTLTSDTAVHPLKVERTHARLIRNIAIEWGLLMVSKLQSKSG